MLSKASQKTLMYSVIAIVVVYLLASQALKNAADQAQARALLVGGLVMVYMTLWGPKVPSKNVNPLIHK